MPHSKVNDSMRQRLPALWANSELTLIDIGKRFGVSAGTITATAKRMGLPERAKPARLTRRNRELQGRQKKVIDATDKNS